VDDDNPEVNFSFKFSKPSGRHVVTLENISKSYPNVEILENTDGLIEKGDKIALIGANGKGKSTLLRIVADADKEFEGKSTKGHNVSQTFFAQHQLEALHLENSVLQELVAFAPKHTETELRSILGSFLFTGDDVFKKIKVLSGGEKSRVALAKALTADANFLVLDEPTNHLDMASVNILIQALQQYEGSFIVVSHDRYFLDNIANKIWFIENKEIKEYPGSYQEYEEWNSKRVIKPEIKQEKKPKEEPKKEKAAPTEDVKRIIQKKNKELSILEEKIEEQEVLVKRLETELAQEDIYSDAVKLQEYTRNYNSEKAKLETLQQDWESLAEEIMNLEG
jgi:ATP-binding cassette subfamily F protein 3